MAYLSKINLDGTARDLKDAEAFSTRDSAETALADADTFPFYDASASGKRKSTYSNLFSKLRTSLGSMTAAQLKAGSDTTIRGMRADYARTGVRQIIGESVGNDVIETLGSKAQASYAIGDYFYANDGYYYVATAAITANSTTIHSGTNCSKTSISGAMKSIKESFTIDDSLYTDINNTSAAKALVTSYYDISSATVGFCRFSYARSKDWNTISFGLWVYLTNVSSPGSGAGIKMTLPFNMPRFANYGGIFMNGTTVSNSNYKLKDFAYTARDSDQANAITIRKQAFSVGCVNGVITINIPQITLTGCSQA